MSKNPFEVPGEMRDLASRSVEQARRAFETFIGAAQKASDAVAIGGHPLQKNMAEASRMTVAYAERNMNAAFDMAERLVQAKTVEEVVKIQTEFMQAQALALRGQIAEAGVNAKQQFDSATAQVKETVEAAARETAQAQETVKAAVDDMARTSAAAVKDAMAKAAPAKPAPAKPAPAKPAPAKPAPAKATPAAAAPTKAQATPAKAEAPKAPVKPVAATPAAKPVAPKPSGKPKA